MTGFNTPARIATENFAQTEGDIRDFKKKNPGLIRVGFTSLVSNGAFASDTLWTKGTGWTIGTGVATKAAGTASGIQQTVLTIGRHYTATQTMSGRTAGDLLSYFGTGTISSPYSPNTTSSASGTASGSGLFSFHATSTFDGSIDNGHVWEADPADNAPWLRIPYGYRVLDGSDLHPLASVHRDGDFLHAVDFTEIWRNGQCFIKPVTAPGVSTRFSVVGYLGI